MLTPAVRAEARQWAEKHLFESVAQNAGQAGYLQGYCRGYAARPDRHLYPLAGQAELHRTLGAYVAEGITVYLPRTGQYGRLLGLPYRYGSQGGEAVAEVEVYHSPESQQEGGGGLIEEVSGPVVPVLYPFSLLGQYANSFRSDATAHTAMLELAATLCGAPVREIVEAHYSEADASARIWLQYEDEGGDFCDTYLWPDGAALDANGEAMQLADWLRRANFAVGLRPDQYCRRVVGHDYASGVGPLERKEVACG